MMIAMDIFLLCVASVFVGIALTLYLLFWLLTRASGNEIGDSAQGCLLSVFWLLPLMVSGVVVGFVWLS